jgi:hypothetical protein
VRLVNNLLMSSDVDKLAKIYKHAGQVNSNSSMVMASTVRAKIESFVTESFLFLKKNSTVDLEQVSHYVASDRRPTSRAVALWGLTFADTFAGR